MIKQVRTGVSYLRVSNYINDPCQELIYKLVNQYGHRGLTGVSLLSLGSESIIEFFFRRVTFVGMAN
jgi:hypothetical protein